MAGEKVVTNPVSLSARDVELLDSSAVVYGATMQRRINAERNPAIKKLLELEMDEVEAARKALKKS